MVSPVIVRRHDGVQSYLVLDDNPRELLRHVGFAEEFSVRPWLGSTDALDALEEWAEMLAEDPENYAITDAENRDYCLESSFWDGIPMWPPR
ncbi:MAG: hypothetical protein P8168_11265 [Deltaproteobacteria bacterium]|jgi:hypothetical protein